MSGSEEAYIWMGTDADGVAHTGRMLLALGDLAPLVKARYRAGWRVLRVTRGEHLVAAIGAHPATGHRTWWSEGTS